VIFKNVAGGIYLYAGKTGDAANITGNISKDGAAPAAFATTNPTEIGGGVYWQPLAQAETNCNSGAAYWSSTTAGVQIDPVFFSTDNGQLSGLGFTVPGFLDVNVQYVNDSLIKGAGTASNPWGPT
jgi:hypothetical protein